MKYFEIFRKILKKS